MKIDELKKYNFAEIKSAGPRYTPGQEKNAPNLHIQELEDALDALSLSKGFRERTQQLNKQLTKAISDSSRQIDEIFKKKKRSPTYLKHLIEKLFLAGPKDATHLVKEIKIVLKTINTAIRKKEVELFELERKAREKAKEDAALGIQSSQTHNDNYGRQQLRRFEDSIAEVRSYFNSEASALIGNNCTLLLGEWGTGKTHSLCDYVKKLIELNHFCVFSIAQNFPLGVDPLSAICQSSKLSKNINTLLQELEKFGNSNKCRSLIIIDGINEGDRDEWKKTVGEFYKLVHGLEHVGLVLSCRSPFQNLIFNQRLLKSYKTLYHHGFSEIEFEAQEEFFKYYKIPFPEIPLLSEEFSRPLTLKLICKALEGLTISKKRSTFAGIASGQKGMTYVLEKYIQDLGEIIEKEFELPGKFCWTLLKGTKKTKNRLEDGLAVRMAETQKEILAHDEVIDVILNATQWAAKKDAQKLLKALVHSGILFEHAIWTENGYVEAVKLPYQKFSDHIIARHLLEKFLNKDSLSTVKRSFYSDRPLGKIFKISEFGHEYEMPNWAEALMIEFPERIKKLAQKNRELVYYLPKNKRLILPSLEPFLNILLWRPPSSFCRGTDLIISQLLDGGDASARHKVLDTLLALSVKKGHPYNATRLNEFLIKLDMHKRDLVWSEFLRTSYSTSTAYKIISWSLTVSSQGVSKAVANNCFIILMWFLTSVSRPQRDKATEAIIKLGFLYSDLLFKLTLYSLTINDPYVPERMVSASYGIAMNKWKGGRKKFKEPFISFAKELVQEMFLPTSKYSTHNAITRDSAIGCIEIARRIDKRCISNQHIKYLKAPYSQIKSPFKNPKRISKEKVEAVNSALSMDFRNYTVGRLVPGRGNYQDNHKDYQQVLKQIKGRMYDLGYRYEEFKEIDREIPQYQRVDRSDSPTKIDRYGKKYSWIAYYEMYGYREANGLLDEDRGRNRLSDISFDPSLPVSPKPGTLRLPNLFKRKFKGYADWLQNGPIPNYRNILVRDKIRGEYGPWVLLDGFVQQSNQKDDREIFTFLRGLLIEEKNIAELKQKYFSREYPGNSSIPEPPQDYYAFAGETPWSRRHGAYLRYANGRARRDLQKAFGNSEFVLYKRPSKDLQSIEVKIENNTITLIPGRSQAGRWVEKPGVPIEIPVLTFSWENYHSIVNDYCGFDFPAPAISSYLELGFRNQSIELFDKFGKRATLFLRFGDPDSYHTTHLLYLRKDLLEKYLRHTTQTIIWAVWGERDTDYKVYEQRNAAAEQHDIYKDHKHIHRSFFQYSDFPSATNQ